MGCGFARGVDRIVSGARGGGWRRWLVAVVVVAAVVAAVAVVVWSWPWRRRVKVSARALAVNPDTAVGKHEVVAVEVRARRPVERVDAEERCT